MKYFLLAAWQTLLAVIQFGKMSWMFSDIAMSGYTAAAGVTLLTSQVKTMFGLEYERFNGPLSLPYVSEIRLDVFPVFMKCCFFRYRHGKPSS